MRRCEDDVKMRRCEDEQMGRWADVKMRRCEDEKMWRWEGVKMSRCEDEKVWSWEDEIQTPTIGRTLRSDALGKNTDLNIFRTRILEYLREGFRWPARPFKHREPIYLTIHLKYTDGTGVSYSLWCLHIFKCRYRKHIFWRCIICNYQWPCSIHTDYTLSPVTGIFSCI